MDWAVFIATKPHKIFSGLVSLMKWDEVFRKDLKPAKKSVSAFGQRFPLP